MLRLVLFLIGVLAVAAGLAWLADRPGTLLLTWQDYEIETSLFRAVVVLAVIIGAVLIAWSLARQVWSSPAAVSHFLTRRRHRRGLDALSSGMIAVGAGDRSMAQRYALQARKSLPNEPLTHLLRAQAAQLAGDKATARRIFEAMLATPDTEQLGLRGLFLEAAREGEMEAQRQFAERAHRLNPKLAWPVEALFKLECRAGDWAAALTTLATARRNGLVERAVADRRRAVLLTAQAQVLEEKVPEKALALSLEAHGLAPDLIPAAAIPGRLLASRGNTARAAKVIQQTWAKAPHPDLATAYAYARIGDSPRDRLGRMKQLATLNPQSVESGIAVAVAAIEAHEYDEARSSLSPYLETGLTRRIATLMARLEGEEHGDKGRVREWLARAITAGRDPVWTADGVVSEQWAPVSPVTGELDAFQWRVPVEELDSAERGTVGHDLDELMAIAEPVTIVPAEEVAGEAPAEAAAAETAEPEKPDPAAATDVVAATPAPRDDGREPLPEPEVQAAPREFKTRRSPGPAKPAEPSNARNEGGGADQRQAQKQRTSGKKGETPIYIPPRAPDDPGTEIGEADDIAPLRPSRA